MMKLFTQANDDRQSNRAQPKDDGFTDQGLARYDWHEVPIGHGGRCWELRPVDHK